MNLLNGLRWVAGAFTGTLNWTPTANRSIVLPDDSGTLLLDDRPIGSLNSGVSVRGYSPIVTVAASKTLALSDANTTQICSAAATITIPLNSTAAFPIGTEITIFRNTSGTINLVPTGGVTVTNRDGATNTLTTVLNFTTLKKTGTDAWIAVNPIPDNAFLPGNPTTTTQPAGTNNTTIATTAYVAGATSFVSPLGLLVYAQQDTASPLSQYAYVSIPFATEVSDSQNLFSVGVFTPSFSGIYRICCTLRLVCSSQHGLYAVALFQGGTNFALLCESETYIASILDSYRVDVPLIAGTAYHIRGYSNGTLPTVAIEAGTKNSLTIERLS